MTYRDLLYKAIRLCDKGEITLGQYEEMTKPLDREVEQEPKTGHWIWDSENNVYRCSCCNQFPWRTNTEENDEVFIDMKRTNAYKFCPNCGKRMVKLQESEVEDGKID